MALWKRNKTWWTDVAVLGQRHRISLKTSDKREAKALEKELLTSIAAGKAGSQRGRAFASLREAGILRGRSEVSG